MRVLRLIAIWSALLREYIALRQFARGATNAEAPERFVARLVELGPAFVKLGQILSTRPDVLPQAYVDALSVLQEKGPELTFDQICRAIERELGKPVDELFATIDQEPAAAASLAQVHRATLRDGTVVAVKVQRPDVEHLVCRDLDAVEFGLRWLYRLFPRRLERTNLRGLFAEFRRYTLQEIDFAQEGRIIGRFCANFAGRTDIKFPRVHWSYTTQRVLTMDWAEGMRLREAASVLDAQTKERLVTLLVDVMLQMYVSDGLFHADLHPGNIFFHQDGTFTLLDFGMYGELTPAQRDRFILYWLAVVQRQTRRAFHHFKAQTRMLPGANQEAFFARFAALAEKFYASRLSEMSFTKVYIEMMKAGYEFGFVFPSELMLHAKALTTAETLIFVLAPEARFERLSRPFIAREYAERTGSLDLLKRRATQLLPELLLLGELPPADSLDDTWDWGATGEVFNELRDRIGDAARSSLEQGGFWQTLFEQHVRSVLKTTRLAGSEGDLLKQTWELYYELEPSVAVQPTIGAVFTTHVSAVILALHKTLLRHGITAGESYRLIYDMGWRFYTKMGEPPLLVASAFTRDLRKRLKLATDLFRIFPFGVPSYEWRDVPTTDGAIAFDCVKCPVADFFAKHNASELCVQVACRLDFPLAEKWGGRLARTGTIASGAAYCDFRWYPQQPTHRKEAPGVSVINSEGGLDGKSDRRGRAASEDRDAYDAKGRSGCERAGNHTRLAKRGGNSASRHS
jgi:ubiquinone biosynthesis protein